ncbi:MAG: glucosaminidase domain-containing protein [Proteobacteria bacterium]|nr:glucosaminidase domain-containing protein [Pseudomonadota bacterium]
MIRTNGALLRAGLFFVFKLTLAWCCFSGSAHAGCWVWDYFTNGVYTGSGPVTCDPVEWIRTGAGVQKLMDGGGGGAGEVGNKGNADGKKDPKKDPCNTKGNPIVYSTGNKIEPETDFESKGSSGLSFHRTYNNYWDGIGILGRNWLTDYDYKLAFNDSSPSGTCYPKPGGTCATPPTSVTTFWAMRPDGIQIKFNYNATQGVWWEDKPNPISKIVRNADGTYTLYGESHNVERYSATGYVLSVMSEQGVGWTFTYDANNYLKKVAHTSGRYVLFAWTGSQLTRVTDPQGNQYNYTYLANRDGAGSNLLLSATLPGSVPTTITYYYEDARFPFGLTGKDFNGTRYSTFAYDAAGRAILTQHGSGLQTMDKYSFSYTDPGDGTLTVLETNPLGRQTTYRFVNGNISSTTGSGGANCMGTSKTHTYDANGYDFQETDFNGNITQYTYAATGQLQQKIEAFNKPIARTTNYQWDADPTRNRLVSVTLVGMSKTSYTYDTLGRLATVSVQNLSSNGVANQVRTTTYSYTTFANGMMKTVTVDGPLPGTADAVVSTFNASGDLTSVTNGMGLTTTYSAYNGLGEVGRIVDPNGAVTDYTYDAQGRMVNARTYPNGAAADTSLTYDATGLLTARTTPDGVTQNYTYDITRHLSAIWSGTGSAQQEEDRNYDPMGNVTSTQDRNLVGHYHDQCTKWWKDGEGYNECIESVQVWVPAGTVTRSSSTSYDGLGRIWTVGGNGGQNFQATYDANDNPAVMTDSLGKTTTETFDALNRLVKSVDGRGGITQYTYDADDNVTSVKDPRGLVTAYVYDGFDQLWSKSSPDSGTTSYTYDANGLRTGMTRADGSATTYAFDAIGREISASSGGKTQSETYDTCTNGKGRLCIVSDDQGTLTNTYTPQGTIASQTSVIAGVAYTTSYTYDALGRVSSITYPNGVVVRYSSANGQLSSMTVTINGVTGNVVSALTYQPFGEASGWTYGNGLLRSNAYDLDGRLTSIATTVPSTNAMIQSLSFGYDANNSLTSVTNGVVALLTQNFGYDELTRLTSVTSGSGNWSWGYDSNGSRTSQTGPQGSTTLTPASSSNSLRSITGVGARSLGVDVLGNRISDAGSAGTLSLHFDSFNRMDSSTWVGTITSYRVNPYGQRTYKATTNGPWTHFIYGTDSTLLSESTTSGMTDYLWMGNTLVGMVRNNTLYAIHTDHLGRPEMVTGPTQAIVWRASNFAFYRIVSQDNVGGLNIGFPGQYYDVETGLWNNGFRDYDSSVGAYVESDPIGVAGGINTYAYANGNPVSLVDWHGLCPKCTQKKAAFIAANSKAAAQIATQLNVPAENVLGLSAEETGWGTSSIAMNANNFFGIHAGAPGSIGTYVTSGGARVSEYPASTGYLSSGLSFASNFGSLVQGISDSAAFAQALVPKFNTANAKTGGNPDFVKLVNGAINGVKGCVDQ